MRLAKSISYILLFGVSGLYAQNVTELSIEFTAIDSLRYNDFRKSYSSQVTIDSIKRANSFSLIVNSKIENFDNHDDNDRYYYKGFLTPLNSYVLNHCSKYVCENFLLSKETGERQFLYSPYDNECETPVLSKDLKRMLVFATDVFDRGSFISVYQKIDNGEEFDYESFESWTTNRWRIFEVVWIGNTSIALIAFDEYGGRTGNELQNVKYFKGELE